MNPILIHRVDNHTEGSGSISPCYFLTTMDVSSFSNATSPLIDQYESNQKHTADDLLGCNEYYEEAEKYEGM